MCKHCEGLPTSFRIEKPEHLLLLTDRLKVYLNKGTILYIGGNCKLDDIEPSKSWPQDIIQQDYACSKCGKIFELVCETYHGIGGSWKEKI